MKVLFYSRDYGNITTTFIRNDVRYMAGRHECAYIAQRNFMCTETPDFLRIIPYRPPLLKKLLWKTGRKADFFEPRYSRELTQAIKNLDPDIIHCHFGVEALMLLDNIDYIDFPIIIHFHGYDATMALKNKAYVKKLAQLFHLSHIHPVACNAYLAKRLVEATGTNENKITVIPNGTDTAFFQRKQPPVSRQSKVFCQVSSLVEKKGHEYTIRAFASFLQQSNANHTLIIAGDGPAKHRLQRLVKKLKIEQQVQFTGALNPVQVRDLLENTDIFLHHSITAANGDQEGTPTSILEAMAMELPVVSTYHSGIPELVEDGVNGYLVNEKDIAAYAHRMNAACQMGHLSINRAKILSQFSLSQHLTLLEKLYAEIQPDL